MRVARAVEEAIEAVLAAFPGPLGAEVKGAVRTVVKGVFERLDLVTREELDVQEAVLRRTRGQLEELERKVAELERHLEPPPGS